MSETWLPNLVGGVSIWKLAVDLNESKYFGGALLVPETEGSDSLPATVRWDLTDLVPLAEARAKYGPDTDVALGEFKSSLDRVAKVFSTPNSGFDKYKNAFTVPAVDADGGANYFYSPAKKKIYVINWGASPRSMGGKAEYVFGYEDWNKAFEGKGPDPGRPGSAGMLASGAAGAAGVAAGATGAAALASDPKKDDEKKKPEDEKNKARPWWMWPLFALIAIALVLLALLLLHSCEEQKNLANADASAEAGKDANGLDAMAEAGADGATSDDAGRDAMADAAGADGGGDAGADGGRDGGKDGGLASNDEDEDEGEDDADTEDLPDGTPTNSTGTFTSKGGKTVVVTQGGAGTNGAKTGPHRRHYQKSATKWRVSAGNDKVSRMEQRGQRFDVWLAPSKTFEGVKVEWQDKAGKWHVH